MCEETQNSQAKRELELGDCNAAFAERYAQSDQKSVLKNLTAESLIKNK